MLSRRQLIFGKSGANSPANSSAAHYSGAKRPAFSEACLPKRGVVCRSCGESCDTSAIAFRPAPGGVSLPVLDAETCTGCGDCVAVCPVAALTLHAIEFTGTTASRKFPEELPA